MLDNFNDVLPLVVAALALFAGVFAMRPLAKRYNLRKYQFVAILIVIVLFIFGSIITQNAISGLVSAGIDWNLARYAVLTLMGLIGGLSLTVGMTSR